MTEPHTVKHRWMPEPGIVWPDTLVVKVLACQLRHGPDTDQGVISNRWFYCIPCGFAARVRIAPQFSHNRAVVELRWTGADGWESVPP